MLRTTRGKCLHFRFWRMKCFIFVSIFGSAVLMLYAFKKCFIVLWFLSLFKHNGSPILGPGNTRHQGQKFGLFRLWKICLFSCLLLHSVHLLDTVSVSCLLLRNFCLLEITTLCSKRAWEQWPAKQWAETGKYVFKKRCYWRLHS